MLPSNYCNSTEDQVVNSKMFATVCKEDSVGFMVYYFGILFTVTITNIIGNSLVISTHLRHPKLHQPSNYFIASLAVSDLLNGLIYTVYNMSHFKIFGIQQFFGDATVCKITMTFVQGIHYISSNHLVAITTYRYIAVTRPLSAQRHLTASRVIVALILLWIISPTVSALMYLPFTPADNFPNICRYELMYTGLYIVATTAFTVLIPLLCMVAMYIHIASIARKQARAIAAQEVALAQGQAASNRRGMKSTKLIALLLTCFTLAWMPLSIYIFLSLGCPSCNISEFIRATARLLAHTNTAVNIFIYAGRLSDFKTALRKDLERFFSWIHLKPCAMVCREPLDRVDPSTQVTHTENNEQRSGTSGGRFRH